MELGTIFEWLVRLRLTLCQVNYLSSGDDTNPKRTRSEEIEVPKRSAGLPCPAGRRAIFGRLLRSCHAARSGDTAIAIRPDLP
jgi:hypothetical protein